jgi:cyclophilin family peptidyl-prolyl cis-trans isomerase
MKNFSLAVALLLLLSACSSEPKMLDESNVTPEAVEGMIQGDSTTEGYDNGQNQESESANGEAASDEQATSSAENTNNETNTMSNSRTSINSSIELKDLATEYSQAIIKTSLGDIKVKLYAEESPLTVNNFLNLAQDSYYNGTRFHRVIKDFMVQGGDPNSKDASMKNLWGTGGPDYRFRDEFNQKPLVKGSLAMANAGPDTNGSQFFIVTKDSTPWLDGMHTNFGEVIEGMEVVEKIEASQTDPNDRPVTDILIQSVELLK